jgi:pyridoxal phosphate enzyme (YggS family)
MSRERILEIKKRISSACLRVNRDPAEITLVAVSKGRGAEEIKQAIEAGITDIGENRVKEAVLKFDELRTTNYDLKWHMVGHLQGNKVKDAVKIFDLIHSVDSLRLAVEIDKQAARIKKVQDILIEVKTSPEEAKYGVRPEEAKGVIKEIAPLKNIRLQGLMTIAPVVENPAESRPYFRMLRELLSELRTTNYELRTLSMGMTDDFEVAIEEGATMLRLGRAIFGE